MFITATRCKSTDLSRLGPLVTPSWHIVGGIVIQTLTSPSCLPPSFIIPRLQTPPHPFPHHPLTSHLSSSLFHQVWVSDLAEKDRLIQGYKEHLSTKDCMHFNKGQDFCPFGPNCFYRHALPDGTVGSDNVVCSLDCQGVSVMCKTVKVYSYNIELYLGIKFHYSPSHYHYV